MKRRGMLFLIIFIHHYLNSTAFGKTLDEKLGDYFIGVIPTLPKSLYLDYIFFLLIYDVIPLIILYFIAVIIKYFVLKMYFKTVEKSKVKKSVWIANAVIYIILICFKIIIDINAEFYVPLFILSLIGMFFPLFLYGKFQKSVTH